MRDATFDQAMAEARLGCGELWIGMKFFYVASEWLLKRGFTAGDLRRIVSGAQAVVRAGKPGHGMCALAKTRGEKPAKKGKE